MAKIKLWIYSLHICKRTLITQYSPSQPAPSKCCSDGVKWLLLNLLRSRFKTALYPVTCYNLHNNCSSIRNSFTFFFLIAICPLSKNISTTTKEETFPREAMGWGGGKLFNIPWHKWQFKTPCLDLQGFRFIGIFTCWALEACKASQKEQCVYTEAENFANDEHFSLMSSVFPRGWSGEL